MYLRKESGMTKIAIDRVTVEQALEALESSRIFVITREKTKHPEGTEWYDSAITALKASLAQAAPEEPNKAPGMAMQALAGEIIAALLADEKDGGYDLTAGVFGAQFSKLIRRWANSEWAIPPAAQPAQQPVACQYAVDVTMPEYRCVGKCQYTTPFAAQRKKEHITNGDPCWCNPEIDYVDPETGVAVIVHKEPQ